jgi:RimJ/RimL family protein N-acetyltransferase
MVSRGFRYAAAAAPAALRQAAFGSLPDAELMTGRLLLRLPLEQDAADALAMLRDPDVLRWNPAPSVVDAETARAWCVRGADWSDGMHATWHAVDRSTGRLVANCSVFAIDREQATARIGYRVAPWQRRCGTGSEVVATVARWSFAELGLARIQLEHAVENVGSCRVASRAGFVLEGTLRSASQDGFGRRHDDHVHGRLATDRHAVAGSG